MTSETQPIITNLLRRIAAGHESALSDLQQHTRTWLASRIQRIVRDPWHGEEVLQDVYTYVWLHAADYRGERGTPAAWLSMLARSRALDRFRSTRREPLAAEFNDDVLSAVTTGSVEVWRNSRLRMALLELPASQHQLIALAFFDGLSHSEIADRTDMPLGTVKTRIRCALIRLREKITAGDRLSRAA
jgi:RNA polymerase sigma-70 factor, ECF subfamily